MLKPSSTTTMPRELLRKARRKLCRRVGAAIVERMAETDTSFTVMAARLGRREKQVRGWLMRLLDGRSVKLNVIADMCTSMGCELSWGIQKPSSPPKLSHQEE